jgi:hypothetical protein
MAGAPRWVSAVFESGPCVRVLLIADVVRLCHFALIRVFLSSRAALLSCRIPQSPRGVRDPGSALPALMAVLPGIRWPYVEDRASYTADLLAMLPPALVRGAVLALWAGRLYGMCVELWMIRRHLVHLASEKN